MSVLLSDLRLFGCANMPEADGATVGGLPDRSKQVFFNDITPAGAVDFVSSAAGDNATRVVVRGRDSAGVVQTPAFVVLNGTTKVTSLAQTFERLLAGVISGGTIAGIADPAGTAATGDVAIMARTLTLTGRTLQGASAKTASAPALATLQSGDGASVGLGQILRFTNNLPVGVQFNMRSIYQISGDVVSVNRDWGTLPTNATQYEVAQGMLFEILPIPCLAISRLFSTAAADVAGGSSRTFYEKVFWSNQHASISLTASVLGIISQTPSLPAGVGIQIAGCSALNDNATAANRQTLPTNQGGGALTFTTGASPQTQNMPANGAVLPFGGAAADCEGMWVALTAAAGAAAYKGVTSLRCQGTST